MLRNSLYSHLAPSTQLVSHTTSPELWTKKLSQLIKLDMMLIAKFISVSSSHSHMGLIFQLSLLLSHMLHSFMESKSLQHYCFLSIFLAIFPSLDLISFKNFVLELLCKCGVKQGDDHFADVHTRLMKKYKVVPQWWFHIILIVVLALSFIACEGFNKQLQLPRWGILLCCTLALFFTLPVGIIMATTNQE